MSAAPDAGSGGEAASLERWKLLALVEGVALMIAVIMPVTPSKTGSEWAPAELVFPDPSYLHQVAVYFVLTNLMIALLAAALVVGVRWREWREGR
ncbi:MAG: hypothetical protein GWM92_15865 [Gemmatimonadetes bacterium]|nr:hypothetical protein [Gemmatimonadota bacterium]NIR80207.1 hypothetical protein [Gemmatimonadota bacterium]NIT88972.1 hypothetical protein [Gemmatimonadota bacterium]NIU32768.1 hypothetical protein [Gemmatimonadota bacterium]NIU37199.1 hypothetical protein [Gemmatimonadota bacterium]